MELTLVLPKSIYDLDNLKNNSVFFIPFTETIFFSFSLKINYYFWQKTKMSCLYVPISLIEEGEAISDLLNQIKVKEIITIENDYVLNISIFKNFKGITRDISHTFDKRMPV